MNTEAKTYLLRQFETAEKLASYHLQSLTTAECLWRPSEQGLHVYQNSEGQWCPDWPSSEGYDIGPPSIAWLTWHLGFWWSMVLDHSFGAGSLQRTAITWPGSAQAVRTWFDQLQKEWGEHLLELTDADLRATERTHWPFQERPFGDVLAWVNIELTKNAAEIGYVRFLYAVSHK